MVVAVRRREPAIDFASAADGELEGVPDPDVLELAASHGRILITHDRFRRRLEERKSSPGVFLVSQFATCSLADSQIRPPGAELRLGTGTRISPDPSCTLSIVASPPNKSWKAILSWTVWLGFTAVSLSH
jgi:hypothetical protein